MLALHRKKWAQKSTNITLRRTSQELSMPLVANGKKLLQTHDVILSELLAKEAQTRTLHVAFLAQLFDAVRASENVEGQDFELMPAMTHITRTRNECKSALAAW